MSGLDPLALLGPLLGGVGLFLLGMGMMTDGLKQAAGPALGQVLARSTRTRLHGLATGALITAAVQSSSAVTVAAIGFVNAGLLCRRRCGCCSAATSARRSPAGSSRWWACASRSRRSRCR